MGEKVALLSLTCVFLLSWALCSFMFKGGMLASCHPSMALPALWGSDPNMMWLCFVVEKLMVYLLTILWNIARYFKFSVSTYTYNIYVVYKFHIYICMYVILWQRAKHLEINNWVIYNVNKQSDLRWFLKFVFYLSIIYIHYNVQLDRFLYLYACL